jgi:hypothetical protein
LGRSKGLAFGRRLRGVRAGGGDRESGCWGQGGRAVRTGRWGNGLVGHRGVSTAGDRTEAELSRGGRGGGVGPR